MTNNGRSGGALFAVFGPFLIACHLGAEAAKATPPSGAPSLARDRGVRVVPQVSLADDRYRGLIDRRFAVFSGGILDLARRRVLWTGSYAYQPLPAPRNAMVSQRDEAPGLRVWDLMSGQELARFSGERIAHQRLRGLTALHSGDGLAMIDTARPAEVWRSRLQGTVLSALLTDPRDLSASRERQRLIVLTRSRHTRGGDRRLLVHEYAWPDGALLRTRSVTSPPRETVKQKAPGSQPFLFQDRGGRVGLAQLHGRVGCAKGEGQSATSWTVRSLAASADAKWSREPFSPLQVPPDELPAEAGCGAGWPRMPARVAEVLEGLEVASPAFAGDLLQEGLVLLTNRVPDRVCRWSLSKARREHCLAGHYDPVALLDHGRAWLVRPLSSDANAGPKGFELELWNLDGDAVTDVLRLDDGFVRPARHGPQYLVAREIDDTVRVELRVWPESQPRWVARCHDRQPTWDRSGDLILCRGETHGEWIVLSAETGLQVQARPEALIRDVGYIRGERCGLELGASIDGVRLVASGKPIADVYDLTASEWAIVLPDGRYAGSARATGYLAFFDADGALLERRQVAALKAPAAVASALRSAVDCPPERR